MAKIDRILRAVESVPWAIQPEKLELIAQVLVARAEAGAFPDEAERQEMEAAQARKVSTTGGIAVMQLFGTISRRMNMLDAMSGGASIEVFSRKFDEAMADDSVSVIVIDVDSPGGSVYGVEELFQKIFSARGKKRVIAVADQLMASAAYYIGVAADELVISPSGEVGSIGVYTIHFDWSEAFEAEGVKTTIIKAGEHKAEATPYEALDDDAQAHIQELVNDYYGQFLRAVAKGRGVPVSKVREDFGQGRIYTAKRALKRGMVDRIATLDQVLAELAGGKKTTRTRASHDPGGIEAAHAAALQAPDLMEGPGSASYPRVLTPEEGPEPDFSAIPAMVTETVSRLSDALMKTDPPQEPEAAPEAEADTPDEVMGQASPEPTTAPTKTAPVAMEETVKVQDTAAPPGGAVNAEELIQAERMRAKSIRAIGAEHNIDTATVEKWVANGLAVETVNGLALEVLRERAKAGPLVVVGADRAADRPFAGLGEQLQMIAHAAREGVVPDGRLVHLNHEFEKYAAASGSNIAVPSDGGFILQPDFAAGITTKMWDEGRVLSRTNRVPIGEASNALVRNVVKEVSRKAGYRYGGVRVYRANEAATVESSKPELDQQRIYLEKLMGLWYATEETLQDATALTAEAERAFHKELTFVAENEIFRGTGAGQCLGILNSDALVSVAKESAQVAETVNATNVAKMMGRLPPGSFPTAAWFIHSTVIPQLVLMTIGDQPVFIPGGNLTGAPFGTLFGMPVVPMEYCATAGSVGDIILADLDQYTTIDKRGVTWQESIHVRFIYDETAFKLTYRFNGMPDWDSSVAEFQGTDSTSPFITLAARG